MRYPASEKLEIITIVEQSHLPVKRTLDQLGIPRRTSYRWYDRYLGGGPEALEDRPSAASRVWNRVPTDIHGQIMEMALYQILQRLAIGHIGFVAMGLIPVDDADQRAHEHLIGRLLGLALPHNPLGRLAAGETCGLAGVNHDWRW